MSSLWMGLVAQVPCVACTQMGFQSASHVHHMRTGQLGKRKSDYLTIALCPTHHVSEYSIHGDRDNFERQFGDEDTLHAMTLAGVEKILKQRGFK
jgi:hypothetical protein